MAYNTGPVRAGQYAGGGAGTLDPLISEPLAAQIIQELPTQSVVMAMARKVTMPDKAHRLPVLSTMPTAYWLSGDTTRKQTTTQQWTNVTLVAEELAVLLPIPDAYAQDANIDLWGEIRPRITEAFARKIDEACLFGLSKPSTWSTDIVTAAVAAGNVIYNHGTDIPLNVAKLAELVSKDGYANVNGWASRPGFVWRLIQGRASTSGEPIYRPNLEGGPSGSSGSLYGYELREVRNGSFDVAKADLIIGDWSKAIIGVRQDITFDMSKDGVIADDAGAVVLSAFQSDSQILRAVMRLAFVTANPVTQLNSNSATRYPFGLLFPGTADS